MPWTESSWQLAPGGGSPVVSSIMGGIQRHKVGVHRFECVRDAGVAELVHVEPLLACGQAGDRVGHCHVAERITLRLLKLNRARNG